LRNDGALACEVRCNVPQQGQKQNDFRKAEAIVEAVQLQTMKFVDTKQPSDDQLDLQRRIVCADAS